MKNMNRLKTLVRASWGLARVPSDEGLIEEGLAIVSDDGLVHATPRGSDLVPADGVEVLDI